MARELPFGRSTPWCSASVPFASVVVTGGMQQFQQPHAVVSSSTSPRDPSELRDIWSVEESSSSSPLGGSPEESLVGCNEIESDEDECDYVAGLAEQIAHSMLDDDERSEEDPNNSVWTSEQIKVPARNVQPSLDWCGANQAASALSSKWSSKVAPRTASPDMAPSANADNAWDLLYVAAGEVAKLTSSEEPQALTAAVLPSRFAGGNRALCRDATQQRRPLPAYMKQFVISSLVTPSSRVSPKQTSPQIRNLEAIGSGSLGHRDKSYSTVTNNLQRGSRGSKVRDEERGNTGQFSRAPKVGASSSPGCRGGGRHRNIPPTAGRQRAGSGSVPRSSPGAVDLLSCHNFPPLWQHQPSLGGNGCGNTAGSGMRAVFLGSAGSRESGGTGVFLPRRIGCGSEPKRKPPCSTVLLPSRIVEALNLNMEGVLAGPASPSLGITARKGWSSSPAASVLPNVEPCTESASTGYPSKEELSENWWTNSRSACSPLPESTPEVNLPTEWTY